MGQPLEHPTRRVIAGPASTAGTHTPDQPFPGRDVSNSRWADA